MDAKDLDEKETRWLSLHGGRIPKDVYLDLKGKYVNMYTPLNGDKTERVYLMSCPDLLFNHPQLA